jgi:hypothetical protein
MTTSNKAWLLNLYYDKLKNHTAKVEKVKGFVKQVAGSDWNVMAFGDHLCTIGFYADLNVEAFQRDMTGLSGEQFCFLLIRVQRPFAYHLYGTQPKWFVDHLPTTSTT